MKKLLGSLGLLAIFGNSASMDLSVTGKLWNKWNYDEFPLEVLAPDGREVEEPNLSFRRARKGHRYNSIFPCNAKQALEQFQVLVKEIMSKETTNQKLMQKKALDNLKKQFFYKRSKKHTRYKLRQKEALCHKKGLPKLHYKMNIMHQDRRQIL